MMARKLCEDVCENENLDVVQLIFSLKGIQEEISFNSICKNENNNDSGKNVFLMACNQNSNIKVIKYIHKLFPSFIHSQIEHKGSVKNGAFLVIKNLSMNDNRNYEDLMDILHYLYLNGINIHLLYKDIFTRIPRNQSIYKSIYSITDFQNIKDYLKVISQDFDYNVYYNQHDDNSYRKPSFWKEIHNNNINNNNNNNNNNNGDEQSIRINEWKNRFDEHVLHHLSKMIQEHMLIPNQHFSDDDSDDENDDDGEDSDGDNE